VAPLPIETVLPALRAALAEHASAVLQAAPGAGKTTLVPLALENQGWLGGRKIVMLEPRRLAAKAAARRMAFLLGEAVGRTVGYRIRMDTVVSAATRIEVVTEGVLTRMLRSDPALEPYGLVIFDEYHERSLHADLGLALALHSQQILRPDLRLLVMSATLEGERVAALLGSAPVISSEGRLFPVETRYRPIRREQRHDSAVAATVREAVEEVSGDVLVFLPGAGEIGRVASLLERTMPAGVRVHRLHGTLSAEAQDAAIAPAPPGTRKVVLATSIAETSLTIEGVRAVVDSGLSRGPRFSPRTGMTRLATARVTRASADQRRGRAGRLGPGVCYRLWSAHDEAGLVPFNTPEIFASDLAPLALDLAAAGVRDASDLAWLDPPPAAALTQARELLGWLGAIDAAGAVTAHGRRMAALPVHPRLAHMLLVARRRGLSGTGAAVAALLGERDILQRTRPGSGDPDADLRLRLEILRTGRGLPGLEIDRGVLHRARMEAKEWRRRLGAADEPADETDAGLLAALAYPDRVAQRRPGQPGRFLLRNGRGALMSASQPLARADWLVAIELDDTGSESRIRMAAPLEAGHLDELLAGQVTEADEIGWSPDAGLSARRIRRFGAIVLDERPIQSPDPELVRAALREGIRRVGLGALSWSADAVRLRDRLRFMHALDPSWPDVSDESLLETLDAWLGAALSAARKGGLTRIDPTESLRAMLDWRQRQELDALAPERIEVPTGSRVVIDYSNPAAPVLAVRLQEVFGWTETPRIGRGRVPLTLHLLSPAYRPVQVTQDLPGFWKSGYLEVRKELRARYPRHSWPEDPLTAPAVRGPRKRSR
jgi:ATP-dependent helicase HrpB